MTDVWATTDRADRLFSAVKEWLIDNPDEMEDLAQQLDSWDGRFELPVPFDDPEDFFDTYFKTKWDAVRAVMFGDVHHSDEYIKFNGYGNLKSLSQWEYDEEIADCANDITRALINGEMKDSFFDIPDELQAILGITNRNCKPKSKKKTVKPVKKKPAKKKPIVKSRSVRKKPAVRKKPTVRSKPKTRRR